MDAAGSASFGVPGAKNNTGNSCLRYGPRTHHAGLEGDHQGVAREVGRLKRVTSKTESHNLSVSGGIMVALFLVARLGDNDASPVHDERCNRNIAGVESLSGKLQRTAHQLVVHRHAPHFIRLHQHYLEG